MTADKWVTLWCDAEGCDAHKSPGERRVAEAREVAKSGGWTYRNGSDYCPEHSGVLHRTEDAGEGGQDAR